MIFSTLNDIFDPYLLAVRTAPVLTGNWRYKYTTRGLLYTLLLQTLVQAALLLLQPRVDFHKVPSCNLLGTINSRKITKVNSTHIIFSTTVKYYHKRGKICWAKFHPMKFFMGKLSRCFTFKALKQCHYMKLV